LTSQAKKAAINAELRKLQGEVEAARADRRRAGSNFLGALILVSPPKGVRSAEWRAAVQRVPALRSTDGVGVIRVK
jgi:hypothetical protein